MLDFYAAETSYPRFLDRYPKIRTIDTVCLSVREASDTP
jgi:hypothetical protein